MTLTTSSNAIYVPEEAVYVPKVEVMQNHQIWLENLRDITTQNSFNQVSELKLNSNYSPSDLQRKQSSSHLFN